jgi:hypothetical protein
MTVNVLLSCRLKLDGCGQGHSTSKDGTFRLSLGPGSTVREVIQGMGVPAEQVAMTMLTRGAGRSGHRQKSRPPQH